MLDNACKDAAASWRKKRLLLKCAGVAVWGEEGGCEGRYCCGSGEIYMVLLWEQTLLRQWGGIGGAPAGADTAAAVGKYWEGSCGSGHCCGSGEIYIVLLREQTLLRQWGKILALLREQALLRQWGKTGSAPAGADTAVAVGKIQVALMGEQSLLR